MTTENRPRCAESATPDPMERTSVMRYRKKPIEIEAIQWKGGADAAGDVLAWLLRNGGTARWHEAHGNLHDEVTGKGKPAEAEHIAIDTLEGTMRADSGDWIIRGVKGEFYPCKPDIFEATYDRVED